MRTASVLVACLALACDEAPSTPSPLATETTVRIVFQGSTTRRTDLPASAAACVSGVGLTHIHPSWRNFAGIPLTPIIPDRYEMTFTDVPVNSRVSFRVNDQNFCDEDPNGAVTRNIFANNVRLTQNAVTPGNGNEPGFSFLAAANGSIAQ
jgi:hypothetical protein